MKRLLLVPALLCAALAAAPAIAGGDEDYDEASCKANPETCERRRQERANREAWCEANPDECKALEKELQKRRQEGREGFCAENPGKCDGELDRPR